MSTRRRPVRTGPVASAVARADAPLITASGPAAVVSVAPSSATQVNLGGVTLAGGARLTVSAAGATRTLVLPGGNLSIDATSTFDLTDNALVLRGGNLTAVRNFITHGFNGGRWNGTGLTSDAARTGNGVTALGYAGNASLGLGSFNGVQSIAPADVIVSYTYCGDTNLDGLVDTDDILNIIATGKLDTGASATWYEGDMNYNGRADTDDILQILAAGRLDQG